MKRKFWSNRLDKGWLAYTQNQDRKFKNSLDRGNSSAISTEKNKENYEDLQCLEKTK